MEKEDIVYQRELLFATNDPNEVGVVRVKLYSAKKNKKIVAVIEAKSEHNPKDFMKSILESIQIEMFKRINVKISENVDVIIAYSNEYSKIIFDEEDIMTSFHFEDIKEF